MILYKIDKKKHVRKITIVLNGFIIFFLIIYNIIIYIIIIL